MNTVEAFYVDEWGELRQVAALPGSIFDGLHFCATTKVFCAGKKQHCVLFRVEIGDDQRIDELCQWRVLPGNETKLIVERTAMSRDGMMLATASEDRVLRIYKFQTPDAADSEASHACYATPPRLVGLSEDCHGVSISDVQFSPHGHWVASCGRDATFCLHSILQLTSDRLALQANSESASKTHRRTFRFPSPDHSGQSLTPRNVRFLNLGDTPDKESDRVSILVTAYARQTSYLLKVEISKLQQAFSGYGESDLADSLKVIGVLRFKNVAMLNCMTMSDDHKTAVVASNTKVFVCNVQKMKIRGREVQRHCGKEKYDLPTTGAAITRNGKYAHIGAGDYTIMTVDIAEDTGRRSFGVLLAVLLVLVLAWWLAAVVQQRLWPN
eukprot:Polyplicarium_translucidae@DN966_c0_g1_i2.p1